MLSVQFSHNVEGRRSLDDHFGKTQAKVVNDDNKIDKNKNCSGFKDGQSYAGKVAPSAEVFALQQELCGILSLDVEYYD